MKKLLTAAALIALSAGAAFADPAEGRWQSEANDTGAFIVVDISMCGSRLCGTITDVGGGGDQSIVGRDIIKNMGSAGGAKYSGGTITPPDDDKTFKSKMTLVNANTLDVAGCALGGLICRSQTWTRVQ